MSLTKLEYQKIWKNKLVVLVVLAMLAVNILQFIFVSQQNTTDQYRAISVFFTNVAQRKADLAYFQGEVTEEWLEQYTAEVEAIQNNPANWVSESEREAARRKYRDWGYSNEGIDNIGNSIYLKPEIIESHDYYKYEEMSIAGHWKTFALQDARFLPEKYREVFPGRTGELKAAKAAEDYTALAEQANPYFDDDLGWWKFRGMHDTYLITIGVSVLVALSVLFCGEYASRADALLLSSKHGKQRLAHAKIRAGCLFALTLWAMMEAVNLILTTAFFGWSGARAFWQNWCTDWAPWNIQQWQVTLLTVFTSALGAVTLALLMMALSAAVKRPIVAMVTGAACMVFPIVNIRFGPECGFWWYWNMLFPSRMLQGVYLWKFYDPTVLFGHAVPIQAVLLTLAILLAAACYWLAVRCFCRHQVEN